MVAVVLEQAIERLGMERVARATAKADKTGKSCQVLVVCHKGAVHSGHSDRLGRGDAAAPGQMLDSGPQCLPLHHRGVRRTKE